MGIPFSFLFGGNDAEDIVRRKEMDKEGLPFSLTKFQSTATQLENATETLYSFLSPLVSDIYYGISSFWLAYGIHHFQCWLFNVNSRILYFYFYSPFLDFIADVNIYFPEFK